MVRKKSLSLVKSPLFTILAFCLPIQLLLKIISVFTTPGLSYIPGPVAAILLIVVLIMILPLLLEVIGALVFRFGSKEGSAPGAGAIKAGLIIDMVFTIIGLTIITILGIMAVISGGYMSEYADSSAPMMIALVVLIIVIAIFVLRICYLSSLISSITVVSTGIINNRVYRQTSMYAAVMGIIYGVYNLLSAIISLFITATVGGISHYSEMPIDMAGIMGSSYIGVISSFLAGLICIFVAILLIMGRKINEAAYEKEDDSHSDGGVFVSASPERRYCVNCGRMLIGGEKCPCERTEPTQYPWENPAHSGSQTTASAPTFTSIPTPSPAAAPEPIYTPTSAPTVGGGIRSTMRSSNEPTANDDGMTFFRKTTDLD